MRGLHELQFIDRERINQVRVPQCLDDDPLVCGVDVSGGGAAWSVAAFRRGGDARSIPRIRIPGEHTRDRNVLVDRLAEILNAGRDLALVCDCREGGFPEELRASRKKCPGWLGTR